MPQDYTQQSKFMVDIGKVIYKVLDTAGITSYPVVAPENTTLPVVIYERTFTTMYTKDSRVIDTNTVDIYVLAEEYKDAVELAKDIESLLTGVAGIVESIPIVDSRLISGAEVYDSGVYIQRLTFEIKTCV